MAKSKSPIDFLVTFFREELGLEPFCERPKKEYERSLILLLSRLVARLKKDDPSLDDKDLLRRIHQ